MQKKSLPVVAMVISVSLFLFVFTQNNSEPSFKKQSSNPLSGEQKIVCKVFDNLEEALKNIDIACVLNLSEKGISDVPFEITKLTKLNELSLRGNQLTFIPSYTMQIPTLLSFDLSKNQIEKLPKTPGKLETLQSLDLSYNKLATFAWTQTELPELRFLKLSGNNFSDDEKSRIKKLFPDVEVAF